MEESNPNTNESNSPEINTFVYATNISVVIILCLCVVAYFIVENNLRINNSACTKISTNANLLNQCFFGLLFLPRILTNITPEKYELKETTWYKIHELVGFIICPLYLPLYFIYLIMC